MTYTIDDIMQLQKGDIIIWTVDNKLLDVAWLIASIPIAKNRRNDIKHITFNSIEADGKHVLRRLAESDCSDIELILKRGES